MPEAIQIGQITPDGKTRASRMISGGRLSATMLSKKSGQHMTLEFRVRQNDTSNGKIYNPRTRRSYYPTKSATWEQAAVNDGKVFVQTSGEDKVGTYYLRTGKFYPAHGADEKRVWAATRILALVGGKLEVRVQETGVGTMAYDEFIDHPLFELRCASICGKCGRELEDPVSIQRGLGPICFGAATGSQHQVKVKPDPEFVQVPPRPTTEEDFAALPVVPSALLDSKGRSVPTSFRELASRVNK